MDEALIDSIGYIGFNLDAGLEAGSGMPQKTERLIYFFNCCQRLSK